MFHYPNPFQLTLLLTKTASTTVSTPFTVSIVLNICQYEQYIGQYIVWRVCQYDAKVRYWLISAIYYPTNPLSDMNPTFDI